MMLMPKNKKEKLRMQNVTCYRFIDLVKLPEIQLKACVYMSDHLYERENRDRSTLLSLDNLR